MVSGIEGRTGPGAVATGQADRTGQVDETGTLGEHTVRQGRSSFGLVKDAFLKLADYISTGFRNFRSLFSRSVRVDAPDAPRVAAARDLSASLDAAPAQGKLVVEHEGSVSVDVSGVGEMFEYPSDKLTGLSEQAMKDFSRTDYVIAGESMDYDVDRCVDSLRDLVSDENGQVDENMARAVSQVAHQGLFSDGEAKVVIELMHEHGVIVAGQGDDFKEIRLERLDNGDVRVDIAARKNMGVVVRSDDGKTHINLDADSFYEYSMAVTVVAERVAAGQPAVVQAAPLQYAYNVAEE